MSKDLAIKVLAHLQKTNQAFCFLPDGRLISREACYEVLGQDFQVYNI